MNGGDIRCERSSSVSGKYIYGVDGIYRNPNKSYESEGKALNNILGILYITFIKSCRYLLLISHGILQNKDRINTTCKLLFNLYCKVNNKLIPKRKFRKDGIVFTGDLNWENEKQK